MNEDFQTHLTHITNKSTPEIKDISDNLFEANKRYAKYKRPSKKLSCPKVNADKEVAISSMAAQVKYDNPKHISPRHDSPRYDSPRNDNSGYDKPKYDNPKGTNPKPDNSKNIFCNLCRADKLDSKHALRHCPIYDNPPKKLRKIKALGGCDKCGRTNHDKVACGFVFKSNCSVCNEPHMSFLCPSSSTGSKSTLAADVEVEDEGESSDTSSSPSIIEVHHTSSHDNIILPTFTARLKNGENSQNVRAFKDGGCMRNFICTKLANDLKLPVLNPDVPLKIHGFNSSKSFRTKIVKVPIQIAENHYSIEAVCVDNIKTKFQIEQLSPVIKEFERKHFEIADEHLKGSNTVDNIKFILGAETAYVLPMEYVTYGNQERPSVYIDTPIGVMFTGKMDYMFNNIKYLKSHTDTVACSVEIQYAFPLQMDNCPLICEEAKADTIPSINPNHPFAEESKGDPQREVEELSHINPNSLQHIAGDEDPADDCIRLTTQSPPVRGNSSAGAKLTSEYAPVINDIAINLSNPNLQVVDGVPNPRVLAESHSPRLASEPPNLGLMSMVPNPGLEPKSPNPGLVPVALNPWPDPIPPNPGLVSRALNPGLTSKVPNPGSESKSPNLQLVPNQSGPESVPYPPENGLIPDTVPNFPADAAAFPAEEQDACCVAAIDTIVGSSGSHLVDLRKYSPNKILVDAEPRVRRFFSKLKTRCRTLSLRACSLRNQMSRGLPGTLLPLRGFNLFVGLPIQPNKV